ncbi:MAG: 16S rRNA (adenine(1518)-N(6)/adenine(1519)-N(6))-dimethyltransferase RsmA [Gammaproteobacteria bacterium]|nr:MAG: 16S rRNA (adenine(1518)-N(6)/adenine(1519)-N(6))-dimethyltransferase RsmA [Gammaproteobacteria bacterium]
MPTHRPRKRFGQHFLHERGIIQRIVTAFDPKPSDHVVEIGPGEGVLTRELAGKVAKLDVVELDRDLIERLRQSLPESVTIHNADALKFDFCSLAPSHSKLRIIGNLPYNISTPILFHLLDQAHCIGDMLFMLQKEVVDRMAAAPGGKDYGRLSVMLQWGAKVEKLFNVAPGAFRPPPKVDSSVVRLTPYEKPPVEVHDPQRFAQIVKAAFSQRRKVLRNTLKGLATPETMERLSIDPGRRAETLSLTEFAALANTGP